MIIGNNNCRKFVIALFLFIYLSCISGIPHLKSVSSVYNLVLIIVPFTLYIERSSKINIACLLFLIACCMSIIFNTPPTEYRSWERLSLLFSLFLVFSPLINNTYLNTFRICVFKYILWIFICLSISSFFCYFLGINFSSTALKHDDAMLNQAGYFGGLTKHSMILGPVAGIACCVLTTKYIYKKKAIYAVGAFLSFGSVLLSASRVALLALFIAMVFVLIRSDKSKFKKTELVSAGFVLLTFLILTTVLFSSLMLDKYAANEGKGILSSRQFLWNARLTEFLDSPIYGCGFASEKVVRSVGILKNGVIEPGTSWGAISAQVGLCGLIPVVYMWGKAIQIHINKRAEENIINTALIIYISIHMSAEGYILAAGNPMCLFSWLIISVALYKHKLGI